MLLGGWLVGYYIIEWKLFPYCPLFLYTTHPFLAWKYFPFISPSLDGRQAKRKGKFLVLRFHPCLVVYSARQNETCFFIYKYLRSSVCLIHSDFVCYGKTVRLMTISTNGKNTAATAPVGTCGWFESASSRCRQPVSSLLASVPIWNHIHKWWIVVLSTCCRQKEKRFIN